MDAVKLLTSQHRALEALLKTGLAANKPRARSAALVAVGDELTKHLTSEEEVFYPEIKARQTEGILLESLEEHLSLKRLLADLLVLDTDDVTWDAKFKVLQEQTEHHHKEEEEHLFPKVGKILNADELETLGQKILALQQKMQSAGDPRETVADQTDKAAPLV